MIDQAQASAQDQPVSQAQFPVLLPQGQGRPLPVLVRRGVVAKKLIELSLHWHSSTIPIADRNHDIVLGKINKFMKDQHPGSGYYTHTTELYVPKLESLIIPFRPPPAERTAEDQPFFHVSTDPDDPRIRVDISSGSASLTASQLIEQEALS